MKRKTAIGQAILALVFACVVSPWPLRAQTSPAPAQQPAPTFRFDMGGNVAQVPAQFVGNLIFLPAKVNRSQPSLFQLDSTAPFSSIDPPRAVELGIATTQNSVLQLAGVNIQLPNFAQQPNADFGARVGRSYQGTIGNDVFSALVVEIDYSRQTVRLYDPATFQYSGAGKSFPLAAGNGVPMIRAKFTVGGKRTVEGWFVLNTAIDASLVISDKFAQEHRLFSSRMKTIPVAPGELGVGGNAVMARAEKFEIGGFEIEAPLAAFAQGSLPGDQQREFAGEIGGGILRRFTATVDEVRQTVTLEPNSEFRADDREEMSGISVAAAGPNLKSFQVTQVRQHTPGSDAGVQVGDVIAGVDDEAAADMTLDAIRTLFHQVGHKYKLLIVRDGKTLTINVQMRRLL